MVEVMRLTEPEFPVKVMEPKRVEALPSGEFLYQVKWDGMRWITYKAKHDPRKCL